MWKINLKLTTLSSRWLITLALAVIIVVAPNPLWAQAETSPSHNPGTTSSDKKVEQMPKEVALTIRQTLSKRMGINLNQLKIISSEAHTWPDTCLGLGRSDQMCGQMLVKGWRVIVSDGKQNLTYRTNSRGRTLVLEGTTKL